MGKHTCICGLYKICQAVTHIRVYTEAGSVFYYDVYLKNVSVSLNQWSDLVATFDPIFVLTFSVSFMPFVS